MLVYFTDHNTEAYLEKISNLPTFAGIKWLAFGI